MESSYSGFVRGSFFLFIDSVLLSFVGWVFWLMLSTFTTPEQIGYATTVISLSTLLSGFFSLGIEFACLREGVRRGVWSSAVLFEVAILSAASPMVYFLGLSIYGPSPRSLYILGIIFLLISGAQLMLRFSLLGNMRSGLLIIFESIGAVARLGLGVYLVMLGFGGMGIISAYIANSFIVAAAAAVVLYRSLGASLIGRPEFSSILMLGLGNMPTKFAHLIIFGVSTVFLAVLTGSPEEVGVFYIALMISLAAGALGRSAAVMSIPASVSAGSDISNASLRFGLGLSAPIAATLASIPAFILSLIGEAYILGSGALTALSLSIIPYIIIINEVARLNYLRDLRRLIILGLSQLISLLATFPVFTGLFGILGAGLSVLVSSCVGAALSSMWRGIARPVIGPGVGTAAGWLAGSSIASINPLAAAAAAFTTSITIVFLSRCILPRELWNLASAILRR